MQIICYTALRGQQTFNKGVIETSVMLMWATMVVIREGGHLPGEEAKRRGLRQRAGGASRAALLWPIRMSTAGTTGTLLCMACVIHITSILLASQPARKLRQTNTHGIIATAWHRFFHLDFDVFCWVESLQASRCQHCTCTSILIATHITWLLI